MNAYVYQHCDPLLLLETVSFDKEIFCDWVNMFLKESLTQFEALAVAAHNQDMPQLEFESHSLKGSVGQTGAEELIAMLLAVEVESHSGNCDCSDQRLEMIRQELENTRNEMRHYMEHGDFPQE